MIVFGTTALASFIITYGTCILSEKLYDKKLHAKTTRLREEARVEERRVAAEIEETRTEIFSALLLMEDYAEGSKEYDKLLKEVHINLELFNNLNILINS